MRISSSIHVTANGILFFFMAKYYSIVCVCVCVCIYLLYSFICRWTFRLFLCLGYCKQCCHEHWTLPNYGEKPGYLNSWSDQLWHWLGSYLPLDLCPWCSIFVACFALWYSQGFPILSFWPLIPSYHHPPFILCPYSALFFSTGPMASWHYCSWIVA